MFDTVPQEQTQSPSLPSNPGQNICVQMSGWGEGILHTQGCTRLLPQLKRDRNRKGTAEMKGVWSNKKKVVFGELCPSSREFSKELIFEMLQWGI